MSAIPSRQGVKRRAVRDPADQLEEVFRTSEGWLKSVVRRLSTSASPDDVVQETFVRAIAHAATLNVRHQRAFLFAIAANIVRDHHRKQSRWRERLDQSKERFQAFSISSADQMETVLLKEVILSLPDRERECFVLSRYANKTYQEIAALQGVSVKTVEGRMTKALALCAEKLRA